MTIRIASDEDEETVCETGALQGRFQVGLTEAFQVATVEPPTASVTPGSLNIMNSGAFAICVEVIAPVDAMFTVGNVDLDVTRCEEPPADIAGMWDSQISCSDICGTEIGSEDIFTFTQDGSSVTAENAFGDTSVGTVCGSTLQLEIFEGSTESITFSFNSDGTASGMFDVPDDDCQGQCTVELTQIFDPA
jgi:hypothetical protein